MITNKLFSRNEKNTIIVYNFSYIIHRLNMFFNSLIVSKTN